MKTGLLDIRNCDCMDMMREFPDKHFELAIVDPPYGINAGSTKKYCSKNKKTYQPKQWDEKTPDAEYFRELYRVSANQIVWGGNYFTSNLPESRCWIFWDKLKFVPNFADGELAWTSFDQNTRKIAIQHHGFLTADEFAQIHPTQKPVELYRWLLENYANTGDKILDTHLGSGSSAIACHYAGHHLTACELDADYYKAACERIDRETRQQTLFTEIPTQTTNQTELI